MQPELRTIALEARSITETRKWLQKMSKEQKHTDYVGITIMNTSLVFIYQEQV